MKEIIQKHIGTFVIAVIAGLFSMAGAYIGNSPSQEKLNDSNLIKVNMELYSLLSPNLDITLHQPRFSINSLFLGKNYDRNNQVDIKSYLGKSNKELLTYLENNVLNSEKGEDFIGFEFSYCVKNRGSFTQFIRAPKIKLIHPIFDYESYVTAYRADQIGDLPPKSKACQKVYIDEKEIKSFGEPSYALEVEAQPSEPSLKAVFNIMDKEALGKMKEKYLFRYTEVSESSGTLLSNMDVDIKDYLLKILDVEGDKFESNH